MTLLTGYLIRHFARIVAAVVAILALFSVGNSFVRLLTKNTLWEFPLGDISQLVLLGLPETFLLLLPLGLFLGLVLALGKLAEERELLAMMTAGLGPKKLLHIMLWIILPVALGTAFIMQVAPLSAAAKIALISSAQHQKVLRLSAGKFHTLQEGRWVVYAQDMGKGNTLQKVFISAQKNPGGPQSLYIAERGNIQFHPEQNAYFLRLEEGRYYEGLPGKSDWQITTFASFTQKLIMPILDLPPKRSIFTLSQLWAEGTKPALVEIQQRVSYPIACLILGVWAVTLFGLKRTAHRTTYVMGALVLFLLYFNSLSILKRLVLIDAFPAQIGLYAGHIILLGLAWFYSHLKRTY